MTKKITIGALIALAAIIAVATYALLKPARLGGAVSPSDVQATNFTEITASNGALIVGGLTLGTTGTTISAIITGNASACTASSTILASQTGIQECAVSGLLSTDTVLSSPGAALSSTYIRFGGAYASTTANGYLEISLGNASSTASVTTVQNDVRNVDYMIVR